MNILYSENSNGFLARRILRVALEGFPEKSTYLAEISKEGTITLKPNISLSSAEFEDISKFSRLIKENREKE
jgi:hypothetical protein